MIIIIIIVIVMIKIKKKLLRRNKVLKITRIIWINYLIIESTIKNAI